MDIRVKDIERASANLARLLLIRNKQMESDIKKMKNALARMETENKVLKNENAQYQTIVSKSASPLLVTDQETFPYHFPSGPVIVQPRRPGQQAPQVYFQTEFGFHLCPRVEE